MPKRIVCGDFKLAGVFHWRFSELERRRSPQFLGLARRCPPQSDQSDLPEVILLCYRLRVQPITKPHTALQCITKHVLMPK